MRSIVLLAVLTLLTACPAPPVDGLDAGTDAGVDAGDGTWRSRLFPEDWTPAFTDDAGHFLHDFSWAGYRHGAEPPRPAGPLFRVEPLDGGDETALVQAAIDSASLDGGVVVLAAGTHVFNGTLLISASGVVLRGEGAATRLVFRKSFDLSNREHVRFGGRQRRDGEWPLLRDAAARETAVRVGPGDAGALAVGDDVAVGFVITDDFIAEHGMASTWRAFNGTWQPMSWRTVTAVAPDGTVTLDVPLRIGGALRDGASVVRYRDVLKEVGVENLSVTNAVETGAAWSMDQVHVFGFVGVADAWVRGVTSFSAEDGGFHVQSGGVRVLQGMRVSVLDSEFSRAQNRGSGGNGYLFEVRQSSEVLFADCRAHHGRHNFIQNWGFGASGIVWLRVFSEGGFMQASAGTTSGGTGYSEFHHSLATANLIDSSDFDDGFSTVNRGLSSTGAGLTGTETVFWNVGGEGVVKSMQWGWGAVIGTRAPLIVSTRSVFPEYAGTAPEDEVEGLGAGEALRPSSLYEAQRARRLRR